MRYTLKTITPPDKYPVEREVMFDFLKLDSSDPAMTKEKILVEDLIGAATSMLEELTGRAFITQTLEMIMTPSIRPSMTGGVSSYGYELLPDPIRLWRPPCQSFDSINLVDQANVDHLQNPTMFNVNLHMEPATVTLNIGGYWSYYFRGYYRVRYTAGYGDNLKDVPPQIRQAVRVTVAQWYKQRENVDYSIPPNAVDLVSDFVLEVGDL
jgi:hypothetical protein